ncbi:MAG: uroporphyrinogen-III C-methyltransferase [Pseudomonadota bacterium]
MKDDNRQPPLPSEDEKNTTTTSPNFTAEPKAPQAVNTKSAKSTLVISIIALCIASGTAASGYWVWQQITDTRRTLIDLSERTNGLDLKNKVDRLKQRLDAETTRLSKQLSEQRQLQESLSKAVIKAHATATRDQRDWIIAEVIYLVELANQRLLLIRDIDTAAASLQAAAKVLQEFSDPSFILLHEALLADIVTLKAISLPQLDDIAHELDQILIDLKPLPVLKAETQQRTAGKLPTVHQAAQEQGVKSENPFLSLLQEINKHVVVRRHDQPLQPLPSVTAQLYYRQILRLRLEAARHAVIREDDLEFHQQLQSAKEWIDTHLSVAHANQLSKQLDKLNQINIRPELPNISASTTALETIKKAATHHGEGT